MKTLAFVTTAGANLLRASAATVSVERVAERAAVLTWSTVPSTRAFTVLYGPQGASFLSRRTVAHPTVRLHGLRPGVSYDVRITNNNDFDERVTFITTTASAADGAATSEGAATDPVAEELPMTELSRLEIRVGRIVSCERHPDADSLYVEQVDVGEEEPRTIVSGLVKFVPLDEMVDRSVVVLCNLKPRAMRGVTSYGMLLCASNDDHSQVDPLTAPEGASVGELVTFQGHKAAPIDPGNRATKAFDRVAESLRTDEEGVAKFDDTPFATSSGPCVSSKKLVGPVS